MHSQSPSRASDSLPPLFFVWTRFTFCGCSQFLNLYWYSLLFFGNCTTSLELPCSVIYLVTSLSISAPAFLSLLLFAFCFWWKTIRWICSTSASAVVECHRWLLLTYSFCFKHYLESWVLRVFVSVLYLQFQPSPCSAVQSLCFLVFTADPPWAAESRLAPQGQSAVYWMDGWLAGFMCGCTDVWRAGSVEIEMSGFLQDQKERKTTMNISKMLRKLRRIRHVYFMFIYIFILSCQIFMHECNYCPTWANMADLWAYNWETSSKVVLFFSILLNN